MLSKKCHVKISITEKEEMIEIKGYSVEEVRRLLEVCGSTKFSLQKEDETKVNKPNY